MPPTVFVEGVGPSVALLYGLLDPFKWQDPQSWNSRARLDPRAAPPEPRQDLAHYIAGLPFFIGRMAPPAPGDASSLGFSITASNLMSLPAANGLSRLACRIDWDASQRCFFAQALGSNGIDVRGHKVVPPPSTEAAITEASASAPGAVRIASGDTLRVGPVYAYFLLPRAGQRELEAQHDVHLPVGPSMMSGAKSAAAAKRARAAVAAGGPGGSGGAGGSGLTSAAGGGGAAASAAAAALSGGTPAVKRSRHARLLRDMFKESLERRFAEHRGFFHVSYMAANIMQE